MCATNAIGPGTSPASAPRAACRHATLGSTANAKSASSATVPGISLVTARRRLTVATG